MNQDKKPCPLQNMCVADCDRLIYKIIGVNQNHISCEKFKK
jgi:hypothetical protein